ncbi:GTPase Era [Achromatium sp. WMS2]|nr:GTPase Era [Achromatium sp. WMS2]
MYRCGYAAIIGRPNVGKSTLLNRFIGQKIAITSHKPQTTRHSMLGIKTTDNAQILFVDTPGLHLRGESALNRTLNRVARGAFVGVDLILWVIEAGHWTPEDNLVLDVLDSITIPCIAVVNKIDQMQERKQLLPYIDTLAKRRTFAALIPVSARSSENLGQLEQLILGLLPRSAAIFPAEQISDRSQRFFAAELLREQLTRRYSQELPYQLSVTIETFSEEKNLFRIHAIVWVERDNQKAIIIGRDGQALKATASAARLEMERLFGSKVYLNVWVKVKEHWSNDITSLTHLGYEQAS